MVRYLKASYKLHYNQKKTENLEPLTKMLGKDACLQLLSLSVT